MSALRTRPFHLAAASGAAARFKRAVEIDVGSLPGRDQAENNARGQRDEEREDEHRGVQLDRADARNVLRHGPNERFSSPLGEEQAKRAAQPREQNTFRQQLPNDASAAGTHRGTQRDLFSASRRASEKEIRDVGVRDQENTNDRAEKNIKRGAHISDQFFAQRLGEDAKNGCWNPDIVSKRVAAMASRSDCACAIVAPGFKRATAWRL